MKRITHARSEVEGQEYQRHFWEGQWTAHGVDLAKLRRQVRREFILPVALRAFPRGSTLLEAGCGTGRYCWALRKHGYRIVGFDFAWSGLRALQELEPRCASARASILAMPAPDATFDGALSLGVVEHFEEGPDAALAELARVVRPGGTLLLTVPYEHALYAVGEALGLHKPDNGGVFYQYLHRRSEIVDAVRRAGFEPYEVRYLSKQRGLMDLRGEPTASGPARVAANGNGATQSRARRLSLLRRVKSTIVRHAPAAAERLRDAQLSLFEAVLPGPIFAHTILVLARRS